MGDSRESRGRPEAPNVAESKNGLDDILREVIRSSKSMDHYYEHKVVMCRFTRQDSMLNKSHAQWTLSCDLK